MITSTDANQSCSLCKNENERVSNRDKLILANTTTCGEAEYTLATDNEYRNKNMCSLAQEYLSSDCVCAPILSIPTLITNAASHAPTDTPTGIPTSQPTEASHPTSLPTITPTLFPTIRSSPTAITNHLSALPTSMPSSSPIAEVSNIPSTFPTIKPSFSPTTGVSNLPSVTPTIKPSSSPITGVSDLPSTPPTIKPSSSPTEIASDLPSISPTIKHSFSPTTGDSDLPSISPSIKPSSSPTTGASDLPSISPTIEASSSPTEVASDLPSISPTIKPTLQSQYPTYQNPTLKPSQRPSHSPFLRASSGPSSSPSSGPSFSPSSDPSYSPTLLLSLSPSSELSNSPTAFNNQNENCASVEAGDIPILPIDTLQKELSFNLDIVIPLISSVDTISVQLEDALSKIVSFHALKCDDNGNGVRRMQTMISTRKSSDKSGDEKFYKMHYLKFAGIKKKSKDEESCKFGPSLSSAYKCQIVEGSITVFFSSSLDHLSLKDLLLGLENDVEQLVENIKGDLIYELDFLEYVSLRSIDDVEAPDAENQNEYVELSSSTKALIGVAVGLSALITALVVISLRGRRRRSEQSEIHENTVFIPERHIRSDDSVSNSPTMSSGRGARATGTGGWDEAIQSESDSSSRSDAFSESSSRRSFTAQSEEASEYLNGIEAQKDSPTSIQEDSTYLPSSVLKDLLSPSIPSKMFNGHNTVDL